MGIITLTTDFGEKDYWASLVKIAILIEMPQTQVIDISHKIAPFNKLEASYMLRNSYGHFPKGTVHLIGVDSIAKENEPHVVVEFNGHYFIGADNGILSLILEEQLASKIVVISDVLFNVNSNFPTKDVFVPVACHLLRGGSLDLVGKKKDELNTVLVSKPKVRENKTILGEVIYIDNYGNVVTNIKKEWFDSLRANRSYEVVFRNYRFNAISTNYYGVVANLEKEEYYHGEVVILFNSSNYLEIAVYKSNPQTVGSATQLLGLSVGTKVSINFFD